MRLRLGLGFWRRRSGGGAPGPVNTAAPAVTGTLEVGQVLTCSTGTWTGTGVISYAYQWRRNGANIGGATANTHTVVSADEGTELTCRVTATDDLGSRGATSNAVSIPAAPSALGWIFDGETFTQVASADQWVIDGETFTTVPEFV